MSIIGVKLDEKSCYIDILVYVYRKPKKVDDRILCRQDSLQYIYDKSELEDKKEADMIIH